MEIKLSKAPLKTILLFILFVNVALAQNFVESTCTLKSGRIIQGLLKNDFKDTDKLLFIKEGEQLTQVEASDIELLVINGVEKYTSQLIDFHPNALLSLQEVNVIRNVNFDDRLKKQVLLKVLVEGDLDLLQTQINGIALYYIKGDAIEGLEYLQNYKYYNKENLAIQQNSYFRRQLYRIANCSGHLINKFEYVSYDEKDLTKAINEHNICKGGDSKILKEKSSFKESLRFSVFGGVKFYQGSFSSVLFYNSGSFKDTHTNPNFGAELAFILPNRKRNSELFSRFSFSNLDFEAIKTSTGESGSAGSTVLQDRIKYEADQLEIAIGYRYYINSLSEKNNFGFDLNLNLSFPLNSVAESEFSLNNNFESIKETFNYSGRLKFAPALNIGVNYVFYSKFIFEVRYTFQSDFMRDTPVSAKFSNFNLNFRYLIL